MSNFEAGAALAVIRDGEVVNVRHIGKVYSNGNFTVAPLPGSQADPHPVQFRASSDGRSAFQTGGHFRAGASHFEAWTPEHSPRLRAYRLKIEIGNRTGEIMRAIETKVLTREILAAMEVALGITVGAAK